MRTMGDGHEGRFPVRAGRAAVVLAVTCMVAVTAAPADEGMWLFSSPPLARIQRDHAAALGGVKLSPEWLLHLQQSSVRFNSGGSGSFVSPDGLVLTNHHVGADALQKLGDGGHNYYRDGFAAATRDDELKCHDLELNVLMSIEDVTARVQAAVTPGMEPAAAFAARRRVMAEIENESLAATGLRSDVVTLHQGGLYHLYRSKKYTDVRLVFAPEQQIAFFGGDADNFEFPRYDLDVCFFRAYENGRPARVPHHLVWSSKPVAAGDLVFVSGHPGHTDRASTVRELVSMRDRKIPFTLATLNRLEVMLGAYGDEGPEERRQAMEDLFGVQNGRKAQEGVLAGLLDPRLMQRKREAEARLRERLATSRPAGGSARPSPFERIEQAEEQIANVAVRHALLEGAVGFNSRYFTNARTILRAAAEAATPSGERLREYRDSNRESLELQLFSAEPIHDAFEIAKLADSLTYLATAMGPEDPLVQRVLAGMPPRERAARLVDGTGLGKRAEASAEAPTDVRRSLYDGGKAAVDASRDPMLELARIVDDEARSLRKLVEAAGEIKRQAHAEITQAVFAEAGEGAYPDATFTLRLAYGTVQGYEQLGRQVPPITTYAGLFARAREKQLAPPFDLPQRWRDPELERDPAFLETPLNFVSTADIIGGNSGSPVVNVAGELVGLIFDGNIESLVLDLAYDDERARAVSVDASGILAALTRVYRADALVGEIASAGAAPVASGGGEWRSLFDGRALGAWRPTAFGGEGEVEVEDGAIRIGMGADLSGITWTGEVPRQSYEIAVDAQRADGSDFFCGLTFPVGEDPCSLIVGGWGGGLVGLSSIDGQDAARNDTTSFHEFKRGTWYAIRVRVTPERIECFIDDEQVVDQPLEGRRISIREEVRGSVPLGIATYATTALVRNIRWRPVEPQAAGREEPR